MLILKFIFAQILIFGIIIIVLKKLIFTDTSSALNKLNDAAKRKQKAALETEERLKSYEAECQQKLASAKDDALAIVREARAKAEEEAKNILEKAKAQGEEIVQKAADAKEKIKNDIIKESELKTIAFASQVLAQILNEHLSGQFNEILAQEFLNQVFQMETKYIDKELNQVELISSRALSNQVKERLSDILNTKLERKIEIIETIDHSVLGGIALKFGTLVLDGSLASKIKQVSESIKKEAEKK